MTHCESSVQWASQQRILPGLFPMKTTEKRKLREEKAEPEKHPTSRYWCYALVLLVILLFSLVRIRLRDMPLERDEGEYAYAGQLILEGVPPYQLAYNMKL